MNKSKKPVIAYLHTHYDPEWYRTLEAFNVRLVEIFDLVLGELKKDSAPSFYFDGQVYSLLNYLKFRKNKLSLIKKFIKEKKLFIGPFFVSADSFLSSGSALIKNLETGLRISNEFGQKDFIGYMSDTFGHSKGMFKILDFFNIKNAVIWRGVGDFPSDFTCFDIKTTNLVWGYYHDVLHSNLSLDKKAEIIENTLDKINEKSSNILLLPLGADHIMPLLNSKNLIDEINKRLKKYEITLSSPFEYIKKADFTRAEYRGEFLDNSKTFILQGVYSARTSEKAVNAVLEHELFQKTEVLNEFLGGKYIEELKASEIELLKNQAHDSIYGCSADNVHKAVRARQISVKETIDAVNLNLIRDFKRKYLKNEDENKIGVFNFSSFEQKGEVKIISDKKIKYAQKIKSFKSVDSNILSDISKNPLTEDFHTFYEYLVEIDSIKPFSFKNFEIKKPDIKQTVGDDFIENENLKIFILDNEIYVTDKIRKKTYSNFIKLDSVSDEGDSYNFCPAFLPQNLKIKKSKIQTKGIIKSSIKVTFEENINLIFSLTNNSKYVEIEAKFINKTKNRKLQIVFDTKTPLFQTFAQDSIGIIERNHKTPDYSLFENLPAPPKKELKTNCYPMQNFVWANNLGIITEGLNEYEIYKNQLKITLLRSTGIISNPKNKARSIPAGPPTECHDMQELGKKNFRLALSFAPKEELFRLRESFFNPFIGILGDFKIKNKTFLTLPDDNSIFYCFIKRGKKTIPVFM